MVYSIVRQILYIRNEMDRELDKLESKLLEIGLL